MANAGRSTASGLVPGAWQVSQVLQKPDSGSGSRVEAEHAEGEPSAAARAVCAGRHSHPVRAFRVVPNETTTKGKTGTVPLGKGGNGLGEDLAQAVRSVAGGEAVGRRRRGSVSFFRRRIDGVRYSCTHERRKPAKVLEQRQAHYMGLHDLEDS